MRIHAYICMHVCTYIYMSLPVNIRTCIHVDLCTDVCVQICICVRVLICETPCNPTEATFLTRLTVRCPVRRYQVCRSLLRGGAEAEHDNNAINRTGRLRKDNAHGRRSTHPHGIRHATRSFEMRFAAPPPSIPTPLPSMPNWPQPCHAHPPESIHLDGSIFVDHCQCSTTCKSHCITTHHNTPCFLNVARPCLDYVYLLALRCPCAFFGCDLLACMGHLIFSFLCKHNSAAL